MISTQVTRAGAELVDYDYATGDALLYVVDVNDKAFSTDAFNYEVDRTRLTAGGNRLLALAPAGPAARQAPVRSPRLEPRLGSKRVGNSQLQRLISRPVSTRFG